MTVRDVYAYVFVVVGATLLVSSAAADEISLINGDQLNGRVVRKIGDTLTFETPYAGELEVKWSDVVSISTEAPVNVVLLGEKEPLHVALNSRLNGEIDLVGMDQSVAPIDVVSINPAVDEAGVGLVYNGHVNASLARVRGNTYGERSYADADLTARAKKYRYGLLTKLNRSHQAEQPVASSWLGSGNYDRFLDQKHFLYVRGSVERDRFKDIARLTTIGVGYGMQLIETQRTKLSLRGGVDFITMNRMEGMDERYPALGWGVQASHKFGGGGNELFHDQEGFWNQRDVDEVTVRSRTGLRVPLFGKLNASLQMNVDWQRNPPVGRKGTDSTLLLGFGYAW